MTKRERLLTAIGGGTPDSVPVSPVIHWRYADRLLGRCHWKDIIEVHNMIGSICSWRPPICIGPNSDYDVRWGMEMPLIDEQGTEKTYERIIRNRKGELKAIHSIGFSPTDPTLGFQRKYFVTEPAQWDIVEAYWQDELENAGMPEHDELDESRDLLGDDGVAGSIGNSTFSRLCLMRGMTGVLLDLMDMPDRMHALMDLAHQYREREIQSFIASKGDVYTYDFCWATGAGMSPKMFEEWVLPDLVRLCDLVRDVPGKYFGFYTLGRIRDTLDIHDEHRPIFTHPHNLPSPVIKNTKINESIISQGSIIEAKEIFHSVIGIRTHIKENTIIHDSIIMGNHVYYPPPSTTATREHSIGKNCVIKKAIIDEYTSIGNNVQLINKQGHVNYDGDGLCVRDGILIVTTGTHIPDNFIF